MDIHKNARLTLKMREQMAKTVVEQGVALKHAAICFNVSTRTAAKWVGRYRKQGTEGLLGSQLKAASFASPDMFHLIGKGFCSSPAALEWLADKNIIRKVPSPARLTERSPVAVVDEAAYYYDGLNK